jgi:hypothetical protein
MSNINTPNAPELRGRVMLMLERIVTSDIVTVTATTGKKTILQTIKDFFK